MNKDVSKEVSFEPMEGYRYREGGICAAKGYQANGLNCGLNPVKEKNDLALFVSEVPCSAAAVYTTNKVKGAPILVCREHLKKTGNMAQAVIANSKNANTCNADGVEKAEKMCELAAGALGIRPEEVLVASTGVIGQVLPIEPIESHMERLVAGLSSTGNPEAAKAIMTTDTVKKEVAVEFELDGKICRVGGMAKGSGMICPNMATTLNFITTDCAVSTEMLQQALSEIVQDTSNCLSIDGDTSTNDMVLLLANGLAGNPEITCKNEDYDKFRKALNYINTTLAKKMAGDCEGATALFEAKVIHAATREEARILSKSVIGSSLCKAAIFGHDANFGRFLCALGYSGVQFDPEKIELYFQNAEKSILIYKDGAAVEYSEEEATQVLASPEVTVLVDMHMGDAEAAAWGCDLSYEYVKINADYRS